MTLTDDMISDLTEIFFDADETAFEACYNGSAEPILMLEHSLDPAIQDQEAGPNVRVVEVMTADVADPQRGDYFTISGARWNLKSNLGGGPRAGTWTLELTRQSRRGM